MDRALEILNAAKAEFNTKVTPTFENNSEKHNNYIKKNCILVKKMLVNIREHTDRVLKKVSSMKEIMSNTSVYQEQLRASSEFTGNLVVDFLHRAGTYSTKYPGQAEAIKDMSIFFTSIRSLSNSLVSEVESRSQDLLLLANNPSRSKKDAEKTKQEYDANLKTLRELDQFHKKVLKSQHVRYYIKISRESWDSDEDWTPSKYTYKWKKVGKSTYNHYSNRMGNRIATVRFFSVFPDSISNKTAWRALGLNTKEKKAGFEDTAEFYVEDAKANFFISYVQVKDSTETLVSNKEVSEEMFYRVRNYTSKLLDHKPIGLFEHETIEFPDQKN